MIGLSEGAAAAREAGYSAGPAGDEAAVTAKVLGGRALRGASSLERGALAPELEKAAGEFEGIFLRMLLGKMLSEESGLFGSGPSAGIVKGMFVDQVGAGLAQRRSLGIADLVLRSMERDAAPADGPSGVPVDLKA